MLKKVIASRWIVPKNSEEICPISEMSIEMLTLILNRVIQFGDPSSQLKIAQDLKNISRAFYSLGTSFKPEIPHTITLEGLALFPLSRTLFLNTGKQIFLLGRTLNVSKPHHLIQGLFKTQKWESLHFNGMGPENIGRLINYLSQNQGDAKHIKHLDLSGSSITSEQLGELVELCPNLETLDLNRCDSLGGLPESIGGLTNLETLDLNWCGSLRALPESIGALTKLKALNLGWCSNLTSLPESLINSIKPINHSLKHLTLSGSSITSEQLGELVELCPNLETINLHGCSNLMTLPESIGGLITLKTLNLARCDSLTTLPASTGALTKLKALNLGWCSNLTSLPESLINSIKPINHSLKHLTLSGSSITAEQLGELVELCPNLETINLHGCSNLTTLPESIGGVTNLKTLNLSDCITLTTLPESIGGLTNLETLDLNRCDSLRGLPESIGGLTNLETLDLNRCYSLMGLPESIGGLTNLETLDLNRCDSLMGLPESIGGLTNLETLDLNWCGSLRALPESIVGLINLKTLNLSGCKLITDDVIENLNKQNLQIQIMR